MQAIFKNLVCLEKKQKDQDIEDDHKNWLRNLRREETRKGKNVQCVKVVIPKEAEKPEEECRRLRVCFSGSVGSPVFFKFGEIAHEGADCCVQHVRGEELQPRKGLPWTLRWSRVEKQDFL
ncbi:uncharacterized protein [Symphalangus syndactylus]|uniref:uncharacterized protein isoform X2 n=1 Tax=Symphalangus syndactylus TaxID=9590 RepID=UPI003003A829